MKKKEILPMKEVEWLALHCSSTRCNKSFSFEDLKRCHRAKGYAYDCGYHWYITRDGEYHEGPSRKTTPMLRSSATATSPTSGKSVPASMLPQTQTTGN